MALEDKASHCPSGQLAHLLALQNTGPLGVNS